MDVEERVIADLGLLPRKKSGLGMTVLILRICELCGEDISFISLFFPEYFRVATLVGLIRNVEKRGLS